MLNRIKEIVAIEPFTITVRWNNNELRTVDFNVMLGDYKVKPESIFYQLFDFQNFVKVKTDGKTLFWEGMATIIDYDGSENKTSLDFCPDVLFENSQLVTQ